MPKNNTENMAVIFGEESQFCIVYSNLNVNFVKKKKRILCEAKHLYEPVSPGLQSWANPALVQTPSPHR